MSTIATVETVRDAVQSILDAWIAGVEQENLSLITQIVAPDEDALFLGSGAAEQFRGWSAVRAALEAQAAAVKDIRVTASDVDIHLLGGGRAAWATSLWTFEGRLGDQRVSVPLRCTWICEQRGQDWVLVHFHKSVGLDH